MPRTLLTQQDFTPWAEPQGEGHLVIARRKVPPNVVEEYRAGTRFFARVGITFQYLIGNSPETVSFAGFAVRVPELPSGGVSLEILPNRYPVFLSPPANPPQGIYGVVQFNADGVAREMTVYNAAGQTLTFNYFPAAGLLKLRIRRAETGVFKDLLQVDLFRLNAIDHDDREKVITLQKNGAAAQDRLVEVVVQGLQQNQVPPNPTFNILLHTLETEAFVWDLRQYAVQLSRELRRPLTPDQAAALADATLARV
ncbi:hypothetical protein [Thermus scotoductus]|uniref:Uncharacterized protein n=1 Tax=Thermus scotoductus TaxID=37636 RepID=A0A430QZ73_THESC|nr:hypothetical protein [Thermus scotoductus]RTG94847.1 hypothetical protein CSW49_08215 [Thermus scotoductus]RTH00451.1 hypothetical protein CSW45_13535 [Thermus scotoductus]RTH16033.1 hypothetical protein CSW42_13815 [Thermus scotoductus]RTH96117.1 hypothetical protein CSW28_13895 [Thermus scotoductus]RTI17584.1 hypothetical protein CSW21_13220 [Thermus scotoductus]